MKKKKILKILIPVIAVILAVAVFLGIKFKNTLSLVFDWDNAVSFVNSQRYSREEIENQMKDNKNKMEKIAEENPHINIRGDLTEEEIKALSEGKITKEDAVAIVKGDLTLEEAIKEKDNSSAPQSADGKSEETSSAEEETPADKPLPKPEPGKKDEEVPSSGKKPQTEVSPPKDNTTDANAPPSPGKDEPEPPKDRPSEIIAELYVAQADFMGRLEAMGDRAYQDYKNTHYDRNQITSIVDSYSAEVSTMEKECDAKVRALLTELEAELKKVDGDLSVVKDIRAFYYKEKSLKKTYYLNRLNDEDYK